MSITILCVSFTNSATVGSLEQVQLCNRRIDQSADNITGLKCAKECLILKFISVSRIPDINLNYTCCINQDVEQRNVQNDSLLCCCFTNSATVGSLEQVQICNRRIDQSADNITGLKCAKECLILKFISISRIPDINLNYTCCINQDVDQRNVQNDSLLCCCFTNSATVGSLEQVQLCNRRIDQSAHNITASNAQKSVVS